NHDAFALLPIIQLANYKSDNWAFYEHLNKKIKENPLSSGLDFFFSELCNYFDKDLAPFFDYWGIDLTDRARAAGRDYPLLDETIWLYDPLDENPNKNVSHFNTENYRYRHIRSDWEVKAFDMNYVDNEQIDDAGSISFILDGLKSTRWHSWWEGGP